MKRHKFCILSVILIISLLLIAGVYLHPLLLLLLKHLKERKNRKAR